MKFGRAYKNITAIVLLLAYLIFIGTFVKKQYANVLCSDIDIEINKEQSFLSRDIVLEIIENGGVVIDSLTKIKDIDLNKIEKAIAQNDFVENVDVYSDFLGKLHIVIKQREPILRVMTNDQESFYVDKNIKVMPTSSQYTANVIILSGNIESDYFYSADSVDDFEINSLPNTMTIGQINKFVDYISSHELWSHQIVQIYINGSNEVELVPRVGNHVILLGNLENYEKKLLKMEAMYHEGFKITDWNKYSIINLKYENQVVCKIR